MPLVSQSIIILYVFSRPIVHEAPKNPLYTTPAPVPHPIYTTSAPKVYPPVPHPVHTTQAPSPYTPVSTLRPDYAPHVPQSHVPQSHGYHPSQHDLYQPAHQGTIQLY